MGQCILKVKIDYQHCEEVLSIGGLYEVVGGLTSNAQGTLVCEQAAIALGALVGPNMQPIMGTADRIMSIDVTAPVDPDNDWGPFGYHRALLVKGNDIARATQLTDMIAAQIVWRGINELDEPVRNAHYWSCLTPADHDCMELLPTPLGEIQTAFRAMFPLDLSLSSADLKRTVRNLRAGVVTTYHTCDSIEVSPTLATMIQRRGDITPRRGKIVEPDA